MKIMFENKVFITGGTGSIGNAICQYFNENKWWNSFNKFRESCKDETL